jgi:hypothetical protein
VQHNRFIALSRQEVLSSDIDRGVGSSTCTIEYSKEREHGNNNRPYEPHIFSSCGKTCYGPIEPSGQHSFMEEVSILTLSMLFIVIYLFCIICIYIHFLLYVVLQFLCIRNRPSTLMDASVPSPTTDAAVEEAYSLGASHTLVCVTFYKFTIPHFFIL